MAVREMINRHPVPTVCGLLLVIAIAGWALASEAKKPSHPPPDRLAYFSDDDGHSFFAADANKAAPFDHDGKTAVAAHVFVCKDGKQFVGYLEQATGPASRTYIEVKKPGDSTWVRANSPQAAAVMAPKCLDGSDATPVNP